MVSGIYRISVWSPDTGLTFNQFLIDDEAPTLVHTGAVVRRIADLQPDWIHAMHGATITGGALADYSRALLEEQFAYRGVLFGRPIGTPAAQT
jgi:hypothetical protein